MNKEEKKIKYLNDNELQKFFNAIKSGKKLWKKKRDLCLFVLTLAYGLRKSEIIRIKLEDLNLEEHQIFIKRSKRKSHSGRWYKISDENYRIILNWIKERQKFPVAKQGNGYLFISQKTVGLNKSISHEEIYALCQRYSEHAGIGSVYPHQFRHTCGVKLAKAGKSAIQIKNRLGHSSVSSIEVYINLGHPDRIKEDEEMENALEF